ncbi:MAG: type II CAAX endopeptidase family protein [Saprospiraceae bacterium]|nr:type II CAAX endopeptidase family protein [Saprospiraceae bacterium]
MSPAKRLLVFLALYIGGNILASFALAAVALSQGIDLADLLTLMQSPSGDVQGVLRIMLWIQAFVIFLLPAFLFGHLFYRRQIARYYQMHRRPLLTVLLLGVIVMLAGQPLVMLSYELNQAIPLPGWMRNMEDNAAQIMSGILDMPDVGALIHTLVLVAVLPAIGEELVFRGILQRQLGEWFRSDHAAVWVSAVIFSAVHMQFEGFLPRMALGALLGYLYVWSRNLWIPIAGHLVNNGIPLVVLYFTGTDLTQVDAQDYPGVTVWGIMVSIVVLYFASAWIRRKTRRHAEP